MNPIQTLREALEILRGAVGHADTIATADRGLAALAELEKQEPIGHLHSNGDFCQTQSINAVDWPVPVFAAPASQQPRQCGLCNYQHGHQIGCENNPVDIALEARAAQQQQAEAVPQKPRLIGWRTSDYLMETADKAKADNWAVHHEMLPIFEGDPYTKLAAAPKGQP